MPPIWPWRAWTRLGQPEVATPIPLTDMLPAASQGIVGVVMREEADADTAAVLHKLNHVPTAAAAMIERAFLAGAGWILPHANRGAHI
jgi:hydroxymethylbilane synthase